MSKIRGYLFGVAIVAGCLLMTSSTLWAAICQGGECDRDDQEEIAVPTPEAAEPTAKPTRRARQMPWGNKIPQNCNQCINSVLQICNKECKSAKKDEVLICRQSCANRYCAAYCFGQ